ncbi:MAG: carbon storage regulator CsrA [Mariprofundaceae bacterium]
MLILTRKMGETITIGENIQISVLNIKGGQVRVGIDAPQNVKINREEVFERLQEEQQEQQQEQIETAASKIIDESER